MKDLRAFFQNLDIKVGFFFTSFKLPVEVSNEKLKQVISTKLNFENQTHLLLTVLSAFFAYQDFQLRLDAVCFVCGELSFLTNETSDWRAAGWNQACNYGRKWTSGERKNQSSRNLWHFRTHWSPTRDKECKGSYAKASARRKMLNGTLIFVIQKLVMPVTQIDENRKPKFALSTFWWQTRDY